MYLFSKPYLVSNALHSSPKLLENFSIIVGSLFDILNRLFLLRPIPHLLHH